jgi:predicted flap endonuclease-1-like 5' DNA nuclease
MTVLPAIFLAERYLANRNAFKDLRWPSFEVTPRLLRRVFLTGIAFAVLTLFWPRYFFPMVWGALTLLLEPWNYRLDPKRSLLGDLAQGRPGRILRLLAGGLAIGLVWEMYNIESRSKWIYTVPGFENFKLFEMPLLGFLGFPIFALDCYVIYQSLVLARVAVPAEPTPAKTEGGPRFGRTAVAAAAAFAFCVAVLVGMDRWNTDSLRPKLEDLWIAEPITTEELAHRYADVFELAAAVPEDVAVVVDAPVNEARAWVEAAQLVTLRGIGVENGRLLWDAGVTSVADLAAADPDDLAELLREMTERPRAATLPKVRVWVRAARRASPVISAASGQP